MLVPTNTAKRRMPNPVPNRLLGWLDKLSFPRLFAVAAVLFVLDLLIPDVLPFVDEILLGLATMLLARLRRPASAAANPRPPIDGEVRR